MRSTERPPPSAPKAARRPPVLLLGLLQLRTHGPAGVVVELLREQREDFGLLRAGVLLDRCVELVELLGKLARGGIRALQIGDHRLRFLLLGDALVGNGLAADAADCRIDHRLLRGLVSLEDGDQLLELAGAVGGWRLAERRQHFTYLL